MKYGSTLFLKISIFLIGTPFAALILFGLPLLFQNPVDSFYDQIIYPILVGMFVSTIPFFIALYKAYKLLDYIEQNKAFSSLSVNNFKHIKFCAFSIGLVLSMTTPFIFQLAQVEDAPGLVIMGTVPIFIAIVIGVFTAVLQRLFHDAITLKSENDLTV